MKRVREERYERQVDALADMKRLAGLSISQAEFSQWESGSRVPRPDNPKVERLYEFFGSRPEDDETGPSAMGEAGILAAVVREGVRSGSGASRTANVPARMRLPTHGEARYLIVAWFADCAGRYLDRLGDPAVDRVTP